MNKTLMLYQGHASFRITSKNGTVIYIDPFAGEGYNPPADIILVTHQHGDHNQINKITQKNGCVVITNAEALEGGRHNIFDVKGVKIEAVEASNANHKPDECAGYIITVDSISIYHAGDTSKTEQMKSFAAKKIDYALLPCDGVYNMNTQASAECAALIGAKHNILMHTKPGTLFDRETAERVNAPNRLIVEAGSEIELES